MPQFALGIRLRNSFKRLRYAVRVVLVAGVATPFPQGVPSASRCAGGTLAHALHLHQCRRCSSGTVEQNALQVAASLSRVAVELGDDAEGAATTLRDGPPLTMRALEAVVLEEEEGGTSSAGASAGGTQ